MTKGKRSLIIGRDPISQLYRAVERYVKANHGSVLVIGGIEIQNWPMDRPYMFRVAVKCTGTHPTFPTVPGAMTEGQRDAIRRRGGKAAAKNRKGIKRPGQAVGLSRDAMTIPDISTRRLVRQQTAEKALALRRLGMTWKLIGVRLGARAADLPNLIREALPSADIPKARESKQSFTELANRKTGRPRFGDTLNLRRNVTR